MRAPIKITDCTQIIWNLNFLYQFLSKHLGACRYIEIIWYRCSHSSERGFILPLPLASQHDSFVATTPPDVGAVCWPCAKPRTAVVRVARVKSWQGVSRVCWTRISPDYGVLACCLHPAKTILLAVSVKLIVFPYRALKSLPFVSHTSSTNALSGA